MRLTSAMAFAATMSLGTVMAQAAPMEPGAEPEPGSTKNRPTGKTYPAGGGARERERRLNRMRSGAGETIPLATVEHGGCGDDLSQPVAVAPTPSTSTPTV